MLKKKLTNDLENKNHFVAYHWQIRRFLRKKVWYGYQMLTPFTQFSRKILCLFGTGVYYKRRDTESAFDVIYPKMGHWTFGFFSETDWPDLTLAIDGRNRFSEFI